MEKYFYLIHDVEGSAYEIQYTLFPIDVSSQWKWKWKTWNFGKLQRTFKSRDKNRIW